MTTHLTEAEMLRALFSSAGVSKPIKTLAADDETPKVVIFPATTAPKKKKVVGYTSRLKMMLRAGNNFEGETKKIVH